MLSISNQSITNKLNLSDYKSGKHFAQNSNHNRFNRITIVLLLMVIVVMFLPWTQNVSGEGSVTTLKPDQRPQTIQSPIPGRIEQWYVQEGNYVKKGDTILRISEVKIDYFDDRLLERTKNQLQSKMQSIIAYEGKVKALESQIEALKSEQELKYEQAINKLEQAKLKIISDSIDLEAAKINEAIAETRFNRTETLHAEGLTATKDIEEKRLKQQSTQAKFISQKNKLLESRNKAINAKIELTRIKAMYSDKIAKSRSELFTAQSLLYNAQAEVAKLENSYSNYSKRNSLKYVMAPQNGYINKVIKGGVGITIKEGESLVNIMPADYELAVETYVQPLNLPLIHIGERVRVQFDGWPAIVFSGWESISYGTYGAKIVAIDNYISNNGMFRVLLAPDESSEKWPDGIRVGSGAKSIALLNDVPIWYELWRQLNGFPPNFYKPKRAKETPKSNLKDIKKLK